MGGLGKTTLAADVYRSEAVKRHFNCKAWIFVSQMYTTNDLLKKIVKELYEENEEILSYDVDAFSFISLIQVIKNFLQNKKYLIVLDDVWNADIWFEISSALLDCKTGSRVILTTRIHRVAMLAHESQMSRIIEILPLSENDSWVLFCKRAFWKDGDKACPRELEQWATKITQRCNGLPLAIVTIGRVLSLREPTESEWKRVYKILNWEATDDKLFDAVKNILYFSFKDLPYSLRNCFLYCSIFPEDFLMKRKRLIRLWVAEGFVRDKGSETMEEVAGAYLDELIHRCLLQVSKRNNFGRVKLCRMHDVVRELTISICQREKFCTIYNKPDDGLVGDVRRLSIQKPSGSLRDQRDASRIRSFFLFDADNLFLWRSVSTGFRLLKVMDLEGVPIETLPQAIVQLFNLRYLGLRKTKVRKLPKSIGRLQNLETLDLYDSRIRSLPSSVAKLRKLRHLFVESIRDPTYAELSSDPGIRAVKGMWNLKSLQTLQSIEVDEEMVRNMGCMTQMRTLRITRVRSIHCAELCTSLSRMKNLENLDIAASNEREALQLNDLEPIAQQFIKLELRAPLEGGVLPSWFGSLTSLQQLGLSWSGLREDPLPCLGSLPNLAILGLYKAYDGENLRFKEGLFPKLNLLMLGGSSTLDSMSIEEGAMPRLRELCLLRCSGMRSLPLGIEHLTTLQVLYLLEMPDEVVERMRSGSANDSEKQKVRHITSIRHVFQKEGRWVSEILS